MANPAANERTEVLEITAGRDRLFLARFLAAIRECEDVSALLLLLLNDAIDDEIAPEQQAVLLRNLRPAECNVILFPQPAYAFAPADVGTECVQESAWQEIWPLLTLALGLLIVALGEWGAVLTLIL